MSVPPYQRIAATLRKQIISGDLMPGDRVPSTRELAREWGVAIATATRALATLRDEGLVVAKPRAGTVVAQPARSAKRQPAESDQTREKIVAAAIAIADAEGLGAVSMRRIATDLGMATMSIYHYVDGKEELLVAMLDGGFSEEDPPPMTASGWQARLELIARLQWQAYERHPWLAELVSFTRPRPAVKAMRYTEWMLAALDDYGLSKEMVVLVSITLSAYVRGLAVNIETEVQAEQDTGVDIEQWKAETKAGFFELVRGEGLSVLAGMVQDGFDYDLVQLFEFGLARMLDGLVGVLPPDRR